MTTRRRHPPRRSCANVVLADGTRCRVRGVDLDFIHPEDLAQLEAFAAALRRHAGEQNDPDATAAPDRPGRTDHAEPDPR